MTGHLPPLPFGRPDGWNGLNDGQRWNAEPGVWWQARLDQRGRAHVIGLAVENMGQNHDPASASRPARICTFGGRLWRYGPEGFDRACRVTRLHEAMVRKVGQA